MSFGGKKLVVNMLCTLVLWHFNLTVLRLSSSKTATPSSCQNSQSQANHHGDASNDLLVCITRITRRRCGLSDTLISIQRWSACSHWDYCRILIGGSRDDNRCRPRNDDRRAVARSRGRHIGWKSINWCRSWRSWTSRVASYGHDCRYQAARIVARVDNGCITRRWVSHRA